MNVRQMAKNAIARFYRFLHQSAVRKWLMQFCLGMGVVCAIATSNLNPNPIALFKFNSDRTPDLAAVAQTAPNSEQLLQQGREFFQAEQFSQAATVWQQAVTEFNQAGNPLNEALALNYLSLAYQQLGQWQDASDAIASSLSLLQPNKNNSLASQQFSILAQALNTQGHLQYASGQSEQALASWQDAAATYSQINDTEGAIGCQINQAQALQTLGLYRRSRKTLEAVEASLQNQPNSLIKATGLRSLGNALRAIGELEKSRDLLQQSLIIAQNLNSRSAIASAQLSLGNTARARAKNAIALKDKTTATVEIEAALDAYQKSAAASSSPRMQLRSQLNQLSLLIEIQQFNEARALLPSIQLKLAELPISRHSINARINLAHSWMKLAFDRESSLAIREGEKLTERSQISEIATLLAIAVQQAKILQDPKAESYALGSLGELYELTQQSQDAQTVTQQALVLAQATNASEIAYRWQWQLGRLLKEQGNKNEAIAAYTGAVQTLQSLRKDLAAINPDNPDIQFSFRESVEPVYRELVDLLTDPEEELTQENLRQARQAIESLQLAELDNFFQEACLDAKPVQIDRLDPTAAVIYPIILKNRLAVILALPNAPLHLYNTLKSEEEIQSLLNNLQQNIAIESSNRQGILDASQQVYDWLIRPAEAQLNNSNVQTLVFILDGLLRNVPMAALHDRQQYLIEKYSIALTPGLQLLPPQPLDRTQLKLLTAGLSEARSGFSSLPNVEQELQQIESQVPSRVLFNQQFTQLNFQQEISLFPFPVVHIATHGQFSSQAENTFILTWDGKINVKELDELLREKKQELSRPIELLVFSACETAAGDDRAALGLAGVAIRAGARSTLATLWRVNDRSTATLMIRFYQELGKDTSISKAEALRRAQVSLLQESDYRNPYYWAPFVLVGNWR